MFGYEPMGNINIRHLRARGSYLAVKINETRAHKNRSASYFTSQYL
jgi:hypothetical protein